MEELKSILVTKVSKDRYCLAITWEGKRYRFYSGEKIGIDSKPNQLPTSERKTGFNHLKRQYLNCINKGWTPELDWSPKPKKKSAKNILRLALEEKLKSGYSYHYKKKLTWMVTHLEKHLNGRAVTKELVSEYLNDNRWSPAMRNNLRSHFLSLESELVKLGYSGSVKSSVKKQRVAEQLHKPIKNLSALLSEIQNFDDNLYLCCLLAYGCLLRPHREIRLLTWGDFSENLDTVSLSGSRTKGKRNRIVPVSPVIQETLAIRRGTQYSHHENIFSLTTKPYAIGYFNVLWTRYKAVSTELIAGQTLYSFRHSGAINVFEKTGSLNTLQQVMGHSSLQVSLTYLRGLEVRQLDQDVMPSIPILETDKS
jgi:integrase